MKYRQAELLATKQITTAGTEPITLAGLDCISRLMLVVELYNRSDTPTNHPLAAIKAIEVVDGSEVIASMTGYAAQAMAYYDTGRMPHNELNYEDLAWCRVFVPINFGRWLYDADLALDPSRFKNLQLRIIHDYALGGSAPDNAYLRVFADMFDEKTVTPVGYLQNKEIFSFFPVTGVPEAVGLPTDNDIRKLIVMNVNDDEEPDVEFASVRIDEEKGKHVLVNCPTMDLIRTASLVYSQFSELFCGHFQGAAAKEHWLSACKDMQVAMMLDNGGQTVSYNWSGGRTRVFTATAVSGFAAVVTGRCPHGAVPILFGDQKDPADWWAMDHVGEARMTLTPRAAPAINTDKTTDVIVQSLQKY